ncbi:flagellar protein FlgN [Mangrovibacillus cuniculi]|uniref:Flagellar protein FlgN n=1 Tax=Mangrovibacillus cuniculi TaxID=2593652 RepID=A0A7S8CCV5_9BACI|nr:flagellar protein FlgN [Mangrovibacillus cuniculi]QPC47516.1 flagellar protein FlgN [Mangrovibacillus cuniculi]
MTQSKLVLTLEQLYTLHTHLHALAEKKASIVKQGDLESLQQLLKDEQKYISAINTLEKQRQKEAAELLNVPGTQPVTITECIKASASPVAEKLVEVRQKILDVTEKIKRQNELNQQLLYQSLQFINMNLDILDPKETQATYSKDVQNQPSKRKSLFDSQA